MNILIENGAYINTFKLGDEKSSKLSRWPVFGAIEQNNLKIAQILIDHGAIIENIETRESILIYLCDLIDSDFIEMNMEIVEFLVNNGADINFNNGNDTPLSVAIMRDWEELEEYLIEKEPVLILSIIMDYIIYDILKEKPEKIRDYKKYNIDINKQNEDDFGNTVIHLLCSKNQKSYIEFLLEECKDVNINVKIN